MDENFFIKCNNLKNVCVGISFELKIYAIVKNILLIAEDSEHLRWCYSNQNKTQVL